MLPHGNLLAALPPASAPTESFEPLFAAGGVTIERIVSDGHASPPGFWYDQPHAEWVLLVQGAAVIGFADGRSHPMKPGDWLTIPAHCRHRVVSTAPRTVWLAVHVAPETAA